MAKTLDTTVFTNDLHEALLAKDGPTFWRCWRSKFEVKRQSQEVDGCANNSIANKFADYFSKIYTPNCPERAKRLSGEYTRLRQNYFGLPFSDTSLFDTEQVRSLVIFSVEGHLVSTALWQNI